MAALRALVVDDEPLACRGIRLALDSEPSVEIVGECHDGVTAVRMAKSLRPDLLFLDVEMPRMKGFDVLQKLSEGAPPAVVLVTAHEHYAVRAFETDVIDYVVKPFRDERLRRALERVRDRLREPGSISSSLPATERIAIRARGRVRFLSVDEVDWVESVSCYVRLHVGASKSFLLRESMSSLERTLDARRFLRIHRSSLVRIDRIRGLERVSKGEYCVVLEDGTQRKVSRQRLTETRAALGL